MRVKILILIAALLGYGSAGAQKIALKNNILLDGMASVNLGIESQTGPQTSITIPASMNLWNFSDSGKFKHIAVQSEFRWWVCAPFTGHFFGAHAHYNVGGIKPFYIIRENRYEGWLVGQSQRRPE